MKSKAYLLCDASFENTLRIGVAAFSLVINGIRTRKTVRLSNVDSSQEAEFLAITQGLKELNSQTSSYMGNGKPIEQLHIFTDSQNVIGAVNKKMKLDDLCKAYKNKSERDIIENLTNTYNGLTKALSSRHALHKVRSHVPYNKASNLEKAHNLVDKMASDELHRYREEIVNPNTTNTKTAAIILESNISNQEKTNLYKFGFNLASHGYHIRFFDKKRDSDADTVESNHPFLEGVRHYCRKNQVRFEDMTTEIKIKSKRDPLKNHEMIEKGCFGLDSCLLRLANGRSQLKKEDLISNHALYHGALSRLIYGVQKTPKKMNKSNRTISERIGEPAEFLLYLKRASHFDKPLEDVRNTIGYNIHTSYESLIEDNPALAVKKPTKKSVNYEL